jgi:hypothetical protein
MLRKHLIFTCPITGAVGIDFQALRSLEHCIAALDSERGPKIVEELKTRKFKAAVELAIAEGSRVLLERGARPVSKYIKWISLPRALSSSHPLKDKRYIGGEKKPAKKKLFVNWDAPPGHPEMAPVANIDYFGGLQAVFGIPLREPGHPRAGDGAPGRVYRVNGRNVRFTIGMDQEFSRRFAEAVRGAARRLTLDEQHELSARIAENVYNSVIARNGRAE